ncbi:peptidoglycan DD-metalloendopeptidase family protein [bacterium]|nr:peptidoglycan DD-metalloendopeptidase family protein [bacterium]
MKKIVLYLFILSTFLLVGVPVYSATQQASVDQKLQTYNKKIQSIKALEGLEKNKLHKNQKQLENTQKDLAKSENTYNTLRSELNGIEKQYLNAQLEYNAAVNSINRKIRIIYKHQRTGMIQALFSVRDLNSFMDVIYYEKIILRQDVAKIFEIKKRSDRVIALKKTMQLRKNYLAKSIRNINSKKELLRREIAANEKKINKLKTDRRAYEKAERELMGQSAKLQSMLTNKGSNQKLVNSNFVRPIGGKISSPFGPRVHPIFKSKSFHSGVDIAGPNAGNIIASNDGTVIYSGWYGGYGKVVIIDHGDVNGNPVTTLYAHMSAINVSQGQSVKKGQVLGKEGSTGYSTGPHCHFEVRVNGKPNNPTNYVQF